MRQRPAYHVQLIRGKRNFTRTAVHAAPKPFIFISLGEADTSRLTMHLVCVCFPIEIACLTVPRTTSSSSHTDTTPKTACPTLRRTRKPTMTRHLIHQWFTYIDIPRQRRSRRRFYWLQYDYTSPWIQRTDRRRILHCWRNAWPRSRSAPKCVRTSTTSSSS
jgi:hypothetical protein